MENFKLEKIVNYSDDPCPQYVLWQRNWTPWICRMAMMMPKWFKVGVYQTKKDAELMIRSLSVKPYRDDLFYYNENGNEINLDMIW